MPQYSSFINLKRDIERGKQIVLFVGAGVNMTSSPAINLSWDSLLVDLFSNALRYLAIEKDIAAQELSIIRSAIDRRCLIGSEKLCKELFQLNADIDYEFSPLVKASLIKEILGNNYISSIQQFLYGQCSKELIRNNFFKAYTLQKCNNSDAYHPFYTLYVIARFIILYPYVRAIVSYNYDNFLKVAINILLDNKEEFFTEDELERIRMRNFAIQDISGMEYNQELKNGILPIYHVHGYIPSPSESFINDNNNIVLTMDEYHENEKNNYSWPTATQLHFLSHYTCILAGMSLTDPTPLRMLYHARQNGNDDKIYYLTASDAAHMEDEKYQRAYNSMRAIKNLCHSRCGLELIYNEIGYYQLYNELNKIIDNIKS
ncbi:MAG: SIR2 family protein [Lachnospiraceae bacterium]|nr:SIR2 family protein [Lachnospiraceae bacterium]